MKNLYVNIDINSVVTPFLNRTAEKESFRKEDLYPFTDQYKNTCTTDLVFNIFCQYSATDSVYWDTYAHKYEQTEENGHKVDYKDKYQGIYTLNKRYNTDPYKVWIDRCNQIGIKPWISVRMNDCHRNGNDGPCFLYSNFLYEAEKKGWTLGDEYGRYYGRSYDFGVKEVREKYLGYIKEQLQRYDVYGIELDYMREPMCVKYGTTDIKGCIETMNAFMEKVKETVTACEKIHGHTIKLSVRVPRDCKQSLHYGFDVPQWCKKGYVDVVIPTPRFASSDNGIPISEWKQLVPDAELAPGIETLVVTVPDRQGFMSAETARGSLLSFIAGGADSLYLFNYFIDPADAQGMGADLEAHSHNRSIDVLTSCNGVYEDMIRRPSRFALIWQENNYFPFAPELWKPIPARLSEKFTDFTLNTGKIPLDRSVYLVLGFENHNDGIRVSVNGSPLESGKDVSLTHLPGIGEQPGGYVPEGTVCKLYKLSQDMLTSLAQTVSVSSEKDGAVVNWVEIYTY